MKIRDLIKQTQNECKGEELSENSMGKSLHKVSKAVVDELNNLFTTLIELGSEVSHFIPESSNFT